METAKHIVTLLALVVLPSSLGQSAEASAQEKISNTRSASCLVKVICDPTACPVGTDAFDFLWRSSGVAGKAARDVLGISPDAVSNLFEIDYAVEGEPMPPEPLPPLPKPAVPSLSPMMIEPVPRPKPVPPPETKSDSTEPVEKKTPSGEPTMQMEQPKQPTEETTAAEPSYWGIGYGGYGGYPGFGGWGSGMYGGGMYGGSSGPKYYSYYQESAVDQPSLITPQKTWFFCLKVHLPENVKPAAEEFMTALVKNLDIALNHAFFQHSEDLRQQVSMIAQVADRVQLEWREQQQALRKLAPGCKLGRPTIEQNILALRAKIEALQMELASTDLLIEETGRRIAETEAKLKNQVETDAVSKELQNIVEINAKMLADTEALVKEGRAAPTELGLMREKLAQARIELAKRREQISSEKGGNLINSYNQKLAELLTKNKQIDTQRAVLQMQLREAEALLPQADEHELLSIKANIIKQNLEQLLRWQTHLQQVRNLLRAPSVTILGGKEQ